MTKVKVCGLHREVDIGYANEVRPDYIGFVFAKSKRQVTREQARQLKRLLDDDIKAVGVFVNSLVEEMADLAQEGIIDVIQLHGEEDAQVVRVLKERTQVPIIQAFGIVDEADMKRAMGSEADKILLDYRDGGSGKTFNWELLSNYMKKSEEKQLDSRVRGILRSSDSVFLAGGINSDNVQDAIKRFHPYAVDVSSSVEVNGYKDLEKMRELVRRVRDVKR